MGLYSPLPRSLAVPLRTDPARRVVPPWVHQVVEYLLAVLFGELSLHLLPPMEWTLLAGSALLGVIAATTGGKLGIRALIGPRLHRWVDLGLALYFALSPLLLLAPIAHSSGLQLAAIILAELMAGCLLQISRMSRYEAPRLARQPRPALIGVAARIAGRRVGSALRDRGVQLGGKGLESNGSRRR